MSICICIHPFLVFWLEASIALYCWGYKPYCVCLMNLLVQKHTRLDLGLLILGYQQKAIAKVQNSSAVHILVCGYSLFFKMVLKDLWNLMSCTLRPSQVFLGEMCWVRGKYYQIPKHILSLFPLHASLALSISPHLSPCLLLLLLWRIADFIVATVKSGTPGSLRAPPPARLLTYYQVC